MLCRLTFSILIIGLFAMAPWTTTHAYVGPGMAVGVIAIILGTVASIVLAFVGILWYPIKRLIKGRQKANAAIQPRQEEHDSSTNKP